MISLMRGPAHEVLLEAARGAALLGVGNHGLQGLKGYLLDSVSHSIVVKAPSPVLIVGAAQ